ncbi:MAG: hypothetical protein LAN59_08925 [Acidobacteriia bacterium]|nr:hypothetical protein [Terriglobia bacterium]
MTARKRTQRKTAQIDSVAHADQDRLAALVALSLGLDLRNLVREPGVRKALAELWARRSSRGASPAMANEVCLWAAAAVGKSPAGMPVRSADWEEAWASGTGKSWKQLKGFPERIRKMAAELQTLLCHDWFGQKDARRFWPLPPDLRDYAGWLESRIKRTPFFAHRVKRSERRQWKVHLSGRVKALTGHVCDAEVLGLLDAVDLALNGERDGEPRFDVQTLIDARFRQKRKVPKR